MWDYNPRTFGLVLDLSNRQYNGIRIVDTIKNELVQFIINTDYFNENDSLYLYQSEQIQILRDQGNQVATLSNFDNYSFNLNHALQQTLYIVAAEELDVEKNVCLITDRFGSGQQGVLQSLFEINEKDKFDCRFYIIGIGDRYRRILLNDICKSHANFAALDSPDQLTKTFQDWFGRINGN